MKYLGVDVGTRKLGFATSEGYLAQPLGVVHIKSKKEIFQAIKEVIDREKIDQVVVGKPQSGEITKMVELITQLRMGVPVHIVDETLSTYEAKKQMISQGLSKKKRSEEDAYSASIILQDFLDNI